MKHELLVDPNKRTEMHEAAEVTVAAAAPWSGVSQWGRG